MHQSITRLRKHNSTEAVEMSDSEDNNEAVEINLTMAADPEPEELGKIDTERPTQETVDNSWEEERKKLQLEIERLQSELEVRVEEPEPEPTVIQKVEKPKPKKKKSTSKKGIKRSKNTEEEDALLQRRMMLEDSLSHRRWEDPSRRWMYNPQPQPPPPFFEPRPSGPPPYYAGGFYDGRMFK